MTYDYDGISWEGDEDLTVSQKLEALKTLMKAALQEASHILMHETPEPEGQRALKCARAYWMAHIRMALDSDHGYLGRSMCTMQDTIEELDFSDEDDEEDV